MKYVALLAVGLGWMLLGSTCTPLVDIDASAGGHPTSVDLSAAVLKPAVSRSVASGSQIEVEWTAVNLTGHDAIATVIVRYRKNFTDTILAGGLRLPESGGSRVLTWDTTGFEGGEYSILVRVVAGDQTVEASSPGRITINTPPEFEFTDPAEDITLGEPQPDPNDPNNTIESDSVTIRWTSFDPDGDGSAQISIDPDTDHESGNEIVIQDVSIPANAGFDSMAWDGTDTDGQRVDPDTYYLFAVITDELNAPQFIEAPARITVPAEPNEPNITLAITAPAEDTDFLVGDDPLTITFTLDEPNDVLIDLEVDTDDNHTNGNERNILSQRLVQTGTTEDSFDWDGQDSDDKPVDDGIYRILLLVSRGPGSPQIIQSSALVFRRSDPNQPLVALLEPATDKTVRAGQFVSIKWRDDDPTGSARIRLTLDDDPEPAEVLETGEAEREILGGREAAGDGVLDIYNYRVEDALPPGRYYVFAYIDSDDADPADHHSVAAGQIEIQDPNSN